MKKTIHYNNKKKKSYRVETSTSYMHLAASDYKCDNTGWIIWGLLLDCLKHINNSDASVNKTRCQCSIYTVMVNGRVFL